MSEIDDLRKQLAQSERIRRVHAAHIRHQQAELAELDGVKATLKQAAWHGAFLAQQLNAVQGVLDSIGLYPSDHRAFEEIREIIGGPAVEQPETSTVDPKHGDARRELVDELVEFWHSAFDNPPTLLDDAARNFIDNKLLPYRRAERDQLQSRVDEYKELLTSIWLYVKWHYVTKQLTTEQKNLWANAIDEISERNHPGDGMKVERWWQDSEVGGAGVPFEPVTSPTEPLVVHYTWLGEKTGEGAGFAWGCSCSDEVGGDAASLAEARVAMQAHRVGSWLPVPREP